MAEMRTELNLAASTIGTDDRADRGADGIGPLVTLMNLRARMM